MGKYDLIVNLDSKFHAGLYGRMKICLVRGEGSRVWDSEDNDYLDCVAGIAVNNVGHCHPSVVEAIREQAGRLMHCSNLYYIEPQAELAERLVRMLPEGLDKVFFCNSGTEAVEAAIKLTRRATGKPEIIAAQGSFHGRTLGALSLTGQEKYRKPFEPLVPGAKFVEFGDIEALKSGITDDTGGIILEPVQGEGGIIPALPEYLSSVKSICEERGIILTFDEVQAGMGRTGSFLACQQMGVTPHIVAMAKGLGGGFPIGAMAASAEVMDKFHPSDHASTFGGNPLACSAANAALKVLVEENLIQRASEMGSWALGEMEKIGAKYPGLVESVRGLGLMLGMEMTSEDTAIKVFDDCLEERILVNRTAGKVIRLVPPLVVTKDELSRVFSAIDHSLSRV